MKTSRLMLICGMLAITFAVAWEQTQQDLSSYSGGLIAQWKQSYLSGTFSAKPAVPLTFNEVPVADTFILGVFDHVEHHLEMATLIAVDYEDRYLALDPYFQDTNQSQTQQTLRDKIDSFLAALGLVDLELETAKFNRDEAIDKLTAGDIDGGLEQLFDVLVWCETAIAVNPDGSLQNTALQALVSDGYAVDDLLRDREANSKLQDIYEEAIRI